MAEVLARSRYGTLRSVDPPITVPAWASMFTGADPGQLGLYGFRHRRPGSYLDQYMPTSRSVREPAVWDTLSRAGKRVCVLGMPPGYPPPHVNGVYLSDFLTPEHAADYVYPSSLRGEIEGAVGRPIFDVQFRSADRERIGRELIEMTQRHFALARELWSRESWDFFALHEIGPDRIHHALWKFFDPSHPRYEDSPTLRGLAEEYYARLDEEIGQLVDAVDPEVRLLFVSDHGSQSMTGCFCINDWLVRQGYLVLHGDPPPAGTPLEQTDVDWSRSRAWGAGGYYARIFLNLRGREPQGVVPPDEAEGVLRHLVRKLGEVRTPGGQTLGVDARLPFNTYTVVRGDAPDLMLYFGNLRWRSAGTLGHRSEFLTENDTGPDDAVHSFEGIYAVTVPRGGATGPSPERSLLDIGPTVLRYYGLPERSDLAGRPIPAFW